MVHKTPLRLVAGEERSGTGDQSAAPARTTPEHEAITRKVRSPVLLAARRPAEEPARKPRSWRRLLPAGAAVVAIVATVILVLSLRGSAKHRQAPVIPPATPSLAVPTPVRPAVPASPVALAAAPAAPAIQATTVPELIRLQIVAEPAEAALSLDGNVLASHRLNLEVPKERGIHVISASAPGYIPFNQQVSLSSDVVLTISLRRSHAAVPREVAKPQVPAVEGNHQGNTKPPVAPARTVLEPGMDLGGPSVHNPVKSIDERNPYQP